MNAPDPTAVLALAAFPDETELCRRVAIAQPGATIAYYRGHLGVDRMPGTRRLTVDQRQRLAATASRALLMAGDDLVHLIQRRNGPEDFTYLLVVRPRPRRQQGAVQFAELLKGAA